MGHPVFYWQKLSSRFFLFQQLFWWSTQDLDLTKQEEPISQNLVTSIQITNMCKVLTCNSSVYQTMSTSLERCLLAGRDHSNIGLKTQNLSNCLAFINWVRFHSKTNYNSFWLTSFSFSINYYKQFEFESTKLLRWICPKK